MPLIIKELVVKIVVISEKRNSKEENIDLKLQKYKKEILSACKKMIGGKNNGR